MAKLTKNGTINLTVTLTLEEEEARALLALTAYGEDTFLNMFYEHIGKSILEPHEVGLRSLFSSAAIIIPNIIRKTDEARKIFNSK